MKSQAIKVDGRLRFSKVSEPDDWYLIEQESVMERVRVSDADVEGTFDEMREIAKAIRSRGAKTFRRCAVRVDDGLAYFWSPRNSTRYGVVPVGIADDLAGQIELLCCEPEPHAQKNLAEMAAVVRALEVGVRGAWTRCDHAQTTEEYRNAASRRERVELAFDVVVDRLVEEVLSKGRW